MQKVTVKALEAAKPRDGEYKLTVDPGLYLRVAPDGRKTWLVRYMAEGRQRQIRLPKPYGSSGDGFMSLHEARTENARAQALARAGIDVQVQEAEARDALKLQRVHTMPLLKARGLASQLESENCAAMDGLSAPLEQDDIGVVASMAARCLSEFFDAEGARLDYVVVQTYRAAASGAST
jgi:hypothetical protein